MYDRLLFPTDGSDVASDALEYALDVAATHDATLHVLNVADTTVDSVTNVRGEVVDALEEEGERIVAAVAERASDRNVSVVAEVLQGRPHETIVDYARTSGVDLVVMPTHGRSGIKRYLLGSVTERVVNTSNVPVLTVTPDDDARLTYPPRDVLVPTDGSPGADRAVAEAIALAKETSATLHLLHVMETASLGPDVRSAVKGGELEERGNEILHAAADRARDASVDDVATALASGRAYREILSYVRENDVDVVALGTHGETEFSRYVLGGVSAKLIRTSPVPVLLARQLESDGTNETP
ncbi:universal stress protein [Halomicrobium urmianum]|uniref:universal stress protein n=1 Tax=Halomicrobium urmianum TaxID=1586233 RepID=UPI001CDA254F|nr:universal stress protein [Halomicrobium urmianum]